MSVAHRQKSDYRVLTTRSRDEALAVLDNIMQGGGDGKDRVFTDSVMPGSINALS